MADVEKVVTRLQESIDEETSAGKMNKSEAKEVLEELHAHVGSAIDALEDEMEADGD